MDHNRKTREGRVGRTGRPLEDLRGKLFEANRRIDVLEEIVRQIMKLIEAEQALRRSQSLHETFLRLRESLHRRYG